MKETDVVIKKRKLSYEDSLVKRYPYQLLIRCWGLMRRAEEHFDEFHEEYMEYASNPVNCTVDLVLFEGIPLTDEGEYYLDLQIEDCMVTGFSIISKYNKCTNADLTLY